LASALRKTAATIGTNGTKNTTKTARVPRRRAVRCIALQLDGAADVERKAQRNATQHTERTKVRLRSLCASQHKAAQGQATQSHVRVDKLWLF